MLKIRETKMKLTKSKTSLSVGLRALALMLSMLFITGCTSKQEIKISQATSLKIRPDELIFEPYLDTNRSATTELQASLMAWDLYAYIKELENALNACKEMIK